MHLTLKQDTAMPPCNSMRAQQRAFDRFRKLFNEERPHEALGQKPPVEFYERSSRSLPDPYWGADFTYPDDYELARVSKTGRLTWNNRTLLVSQAFRNELLGFCWTSTGWDVFFGLQRIGRLRRRNRSIQFVRAEDDKMRVVSKAERAAPRHSQLTRRSALRSDLILSQEEEKKKSAETVTHVDG